jgi:hypothetical protein
MKARIDDARLTQAKLEGGLADKMKRLAELGFADTDAAEAELVVLAVKIAELDDRVARGVEELRAKYAL